MQKVVYILATGGTISGAGTPGQSALYSDGVLDVQDLMRDMPALPNDLGVRGEQIYNLSSDNISGEHWISLAERIHVLAEDPSICGFVIAHGTNTMEETAFFLNLTLKTEKPVVLTGSMRPSTSLSADGPMNLFQAVCLAGSPLARSLGVLVCFSDAIYDARNVQKINAFRPQAFGSKDYGCIGVMRDQRVFIRQVPATLHTVSSEFTVNRLSKLPRVDVVHFNSDASPDLLDFSASRASGIILAGAGAGLCSSIWHDHLKTIIEAGIPVIRASRTGNALIVWDSIDDECGTLPGFDLSADKLRILLALCLEKGMDRDSILHILQQY